MKETRSLIVDIHNILPQSKDGDAVAVCVFADHPRVAISSDAKVQTTIEGLTRDGEFDGKAETSSMLREVKAKGSEARQWLLLGVGSHSEFDDNVLARASASAVRRAHEARVKHLHFIVPPHESVTASMRAIVEGAHLGCYENDFYKKQEDKDSLERLSIITSETHVGLRHEIERGRIIGEAVNWVRTLADEPGGSLPPREFARRAALMAEEFGLRVETLDADEIQSMGMGGLWGVGRGSNAPPALIVLRYEPEDKTLSDELWAFVGKGITFDSGGISIKHGLDMYEMKADMAGGAAVLGALRAIAQLNDPRRIVGIVPAAENMPSGTAIKPGDVVKTLGGFTIEVVDTDAEGRLVLSDGISYARKLGASRIVDVATLTGSIIVALGDHRAGLFSNDDEWAKRIESAARRAGESFWRMPFSDDYKKLIESPIADFKNYGGKPDATGAALLLSKFAGTTPWAHLDIAGTAWNDDENPYAPKGSTGAGMRTLVELACDPI